MVITPKSYEAAIVNLALRYFATDKLAEAIDQMNIGKYKEGMEAKERAEVATKIADHLCAETP